MMPRNSHILRPLAVAQLAKTPRGTSTKTGTVVARKTERPTALAARKAVLPSVCPTSSGRSRSTAIASALLEDPSSLLIDGLLLIPPFATMKGPAASRPPVKSRPSARHARPAGKPDDRQNGSTTSAASSEIRITRPSGRVRYARALAMTIGTSQTRVTLARASGSTRPRPTRTTGTCSRKARPPGHVR